MRTLIRGFEDFLQDASPRSRGCPRFGQKREDHLPDGPCQSPEAPQQE